MMEKKFRVGDVVRLKSGGEKMTVEYPWEDHLPDVMGFGFIGNYNCVWFEEGRKCEKKLHQDMLEFSTADTNSL